MKKKSPDGRKGGLTGLLFIATLFFFGILVWVYLQTVRKDYTQYAVKFDSALSDTLVANGVTDANIVSQSRIEKASASHVWVEYFKEISVTPKLSDRKLSAAVKKLADASGLTYAANTLEGGKTAIDITFNQILLYRVMISKPGKLKRGPRVAIVIDDAGYTRDISHFTGLGIPVTFAVLPKEAYSKQTADKLKSLHWPFLVHMPLEPEGYPKINPGKPALLIAMKDSVIRQMFDSNLASVPGAAGISNHMGSAFSADKQKMKLLLGLVKEKGLFYFDSYTTPKTQAGKIAREIGLPFLENRVFLDMEDESSAVKKQLDILMRQAEKNGRSIAIGHIQKKHTAQAIREYIPKFRERGIEFVFLTDLLNK